MNTKLNNVFRQNSITRGSTSKLNNAWKKESLKWASFETKWMQTRAKVNLTVLISEWLRYIIYGTS